MSSARAPDVDVLIIGAGVAGIGLGVHLRQRHPDKSYLILDRRDDVGGTWDLFRFPGVRADSDLHTYAYSFKPWTDDRRYPDGPSIQEYVRETVAEHSLRDRLQLGCEVREAGWSSDEALWTVALERLDDGQRSTMTARWLVSAGGYFRYDRGYTPELPGIERFSGPVIHPQFWPEDLDYADRRIVVIGSGATAVSLLPGLTDRAAHVTMLQRTPTYMLSTSGTDPLFRAARQVLGPERAHRITRATNRTVELLFYKTMRRFPKWWAGRLRSWVAAQLPDGFDVDTHFTPPYDPWDQRLCVVKDGDLFAAVSSGRASVVTDRIAQITETGIVLQSGQSIEADIIVSATGLDLVPMCGVEYTVDGLQVPLNSTVTYKSMMLSGMPNFIYFFGYTNASWTLKVDMVADHFCRLLSLLDERDYDYVVPERPGPEVELAPFIRDLVSGYVTRSQHLFPKQGTTYPWTARMDNAYDRKVLVAGPVGDHLQLRRAHSAQAIPLAAGPRLKQRP